MATQISGVTAVLVSETNATSYYSGGTFQLGSGPFAELSFSASDDDTDFASFGAQFDESSGAGRQLGELTDGGGGTFEQGLASLEDVLVLTDPGTGAQIKVGRVTIRDDNGQPGGGSTLQEFYIFSEPIDPNVTYDITTVQYTAGSTPESSYEYSVFANSGVVCFANGTLLMTEHGPVPVENIQQGTRLQTLDNGLSEVIWMGCQAFPRELGVLDCKSVPVHIAAGALGNSQPLVVSQQHRILIGECFVKAKHLLGVPAFPARLAWGKRNLKYFHFLLEEHSVLLANGIGAESLYLGPFADAMLRNGRMGPGPDFGLRHRAAAFGGLARPELKKHLVRTCVQDHIARGVGAA